MIVSNFSIGCAPTRRRPLMKKCGVPLACEVVARGRCPRRWSSCTCGCAIAAFDAARRRGASPLREPIEIASSSFACSAKQAVVRVPEALVALLGARLERDLGGRLGARVERQGLVLPDEADLVAVLGAKLLERRLDALPQYGHWKSENSTIVTSAVAGPRTGLDPTGTFHDLRVVLVRSPASASAVASLS